MEQGLLNDLPSEQIGLLAEKFRKDPKEAIAYGRQNIFAIMQDRNLPQADRQERLNKDTSRLF